MTNTAKLFAGTALATVFMAQSALADVTPGQVWDDLVDYMESFGYSVEATEFPDNNDLILRDVTFAYDLPDAEGAFAFSASELVLVDQGDGTVLMSFPPVMPMDLTVTDGETVEASLDYRQIGMELLVSGSPGNLTYAYDADSLEIELVELAVDNEIVPVENVSVSVQMNDVVGQSSIVVGTGRDISGAMSVGSLTYDIAFQDPDDAENSASFAGEILALSLDSNVFVPDGMDMNDPVAMMEAGFSIDGKMLHGGGQMQFSVTENSGTTEGATSSASGSIGFVMNADKLTYEVGAMGSTLNMSGPELPLPISASMEETSFNLTMPLSASDTPQGFALGMKISGFSMADMLWGIFDPGAVLPRDPATIAFDTTGTVRLMASLMDEDAMMEAGMSDEFPGELESLTLHGLTIEAAGARVVGEGDFTFDNTDMESFDGIPRPEGALSFDISGANGLIDNLIKMGLVAEEDAMGARMMMSMFAVPGDGADSLKSTIEFNEQGHILANGQRIK